MSSSVRALVPLLMVMASYGCYSASDNEDDGGTGGVSSNGGTNAGGAGGSQAGNGGKASGSGGSNAGVGGASSGGAGVGGASSGGSSGSSGAGSGGSSGSSGGGQGGTGTQCAQDSEVLALAQTTSSCGFDVPAGWEDGPINVYFVIGGGQQQICAHASSQGCDQVAGWWLVGNEIALCDETCGLLDIEGGSLVAELGCERALCY